MSSSEMDERLARFAEVLDVYGARPERWPEAERAGLATLAACDPAAARLLAEARALDNVLAFVPRPAGSAALEQRVLAKAAATQQTKAPGSTGVVAFPGRPRAVVPRPSAAPAERRIWPELGLLAASLFIGLMIGMSGQALPALQDIAVMADEDGALGSIAGLLLDPGDSAERGAL